SCDGRGVADHAGAGTGALSGAAAGVGAGGAAAGGWAAGAGGAAPGAGRVGVGGRAGRRRRVAGGHGEAGADLVGLACAEFGVAVERLLPVAAGQGEVA